MNNSSDGHSADLHLFIDIAKAPTDDAEDLCKQALMKAHDIVQPILCQGQAYSANIRLSDQEEVHQLNKQYRGKDKPTNVLSFPDGEKTPGMQALSLGDIIIADEIVKKEAMEEEKQVAHHLQHLAIHGFLHLYGFDHETDEEAEVMEALECLILEKLNIPNPYKG